MNTLALLQQAAFNWLGVQDQSELTAPETEALLSAVNQALPRMWRMLPLSYRQTTFSQALSAVQTGTVTVTQNSTSISESISGVVLTDSQWQYCTINIGGVLNEIRNNGIAGSSWGAQLLHQWLGSSGTYAASLYEDAALGSSGVLIDRFLTPMRDVLTDTIWRPAPNIAVPRSYQDGCRYYSMSRVQFPEPDGDTTMRSLFRVSKMDGTRRLFEAEAVIIPAPLTMIDAVQARELPMDDEVGGLIANASGIELQRHRRFTGGSLDLAIQAPDAIRAMTQSFHSEPNRIGTPAGW